MIIKATVHMIFPRESEKEEGLLEKDRCCVVALLCGI